MKDTLFQAGIILGRITQLCVDRGKVTAGSGMALADFLILFSEELGTLPLSEGIRTAIAREIGDLTATLTGYQPNTTLGPDDARIMISMVSRWTDMILEELIEDARPADHPAPPSGGEGDVPADTVGLKAQGNIPPPTRDSDHY